VDAREVRQIEPADGEIREEWVRLTSEPDSGGVGAHRLGEELRPWEWYVTIWAMEFVRAELLESELRRSVDRALRAVPGVQDVREEDREVWVVAGSPTGDALTQAAAELVDEYLDRIRAHIATLGA
jgi:hypothetical protein